MLNVIVVYRTHKNYPLTSKYTQFVIVKPLSYYFKETIGFDVKASFASRPVSRLVR